MWIQTSGSSKLAPLPSSAKHTVRYSESSAIPEKVIEGTSRGFVVVWALYGTFEESIDL
jgi:hypothetical protein